MHDRDVLCEAIAAFSTILDAPSFDPEMPLPPLLAQRRPLTLTALTSIASMSDSKIDTSEAVAYVVIQHNWPQILNWMKYFCHEVTTAVSKPDSFDSVIRMISSVISKVGHDKVLFERAVLEDSLLNLIIRAWLKSNDSPSLDTAHRYMLLGSLCKALGTLDGERQISDVREMILREAKGDAGVVTKRLTRQLKNPAKGCKENHLAVFYTVGIIDCLAIEDRARLSPSAFMDNFLKDDLVVIVTQLLVFFSQDIARPRQRRIIPVDSCSSPVQYCLQVLGCCGRSRNGPHWVAVMMKNGFLRAIAGLVAFPQHMRSGKGSVIDLLLDRDIPQHFCHRFVVLAAIKAIKEVTENGSARNFESSCIKDSWRNFESILLDRTVFNAIYERDFAEGDILQCLYCHKNKRETQLFKCAGCKTTVYCSKECQTASWKTGDHKVQCKLLHDAWYKARRPILVYFSAF
ncbi:hypothetical protein SCHPADRAFT_687509 [Schizopora paradoxa]|uniref:MYND-type domain-containing protein n=1 Tax=Schizopora paradoxa TaxID=27342 RepID=A0A0H2R3Y1_9AGAM|nr:hypothetical protein SCHPADRAFT_687509 [Schizopora paradoxa]